MGMYTELQASFRFNKNTPQNILDVIHYLCGEGDRNELDDADGWGWYGLFQHGSYYFHGQSHHAFVYDDIAQTHFLTVQFNIKNYDNELETFLEWIVPYVEDYKRFIGYIRYEEDLNPTLVYFKDGHVYYFEVSESKILNFLGEE